MYTQTSFSVCSPTASYRYTRKFSMVPQYRRLGRDSTWSPLSESVTVIQRINNKTAVDHTPQHQQSLTDTRGAEAESCSSLKQLSCLYSLVWYSHRCLLRSICFSTRQTWSIISIAKWLEFLSRNTHILLPVQHFYD